MRHQDRLRPADESTGVEIRGGLGIGDDVPVIEIRLRRGVCVKSINY